jgi:HPt (histidine-containing phosphotransfer) domain-containing protein
MMAKYHTSLDWGIASALADDAALLEELRMALISDAKAAASLLERSRCDANWRAAALKLQGLAASFGAAQLAAAAQMALDLAPGDPTVLRAVEKAISGL